MREQIHAAIERALTPDERGLEKLRGQGKLTARERIGLLLDEGSFTEDAVLANNMAAGLPADGVVTGRGTIDGTPAVVVANDPMVKAGSWGARTVEKMVRATEAALAAQIPIVWLVDSAGARLTDQVQLFPGRRGAGHIFYNQVKLSGQVPQICCLFGPSAAGGAYVPSFCDIVFMVDGNASMYLGSPRMAEMVVGEITTLEEMGGARMHVSQSGCADNLAVDDEDALDQARAYLSYFPRSWQHEPPVYEPAPPETPLTADTVPADERVPFDVHTVIDGIVDAESFFEIKPMFARELVVGLGRLDGRPVGVLANNSAHLAGTLFVDSADKAARFIWLCDAFNIPLIFLADVPGFMIGSAVERQGIIRHGAKMVTAVSEATVPKISVVVRKAYGAGLYAMSGPAFEPEATIALPTARIAVMGPEAAINAVYANKIAEIADPAEREQFVAEQRAIYETDVDLLRLASELVIDAIIEPAGPPGRPDPPAGAGPGQGPPLRPPPPRRPPGLTPVVPMEVAVREVGPRDGLQGERPVPVEARVDLVRRLFAAGLRDVEVAAFVSPKAVPAMAGAAEVVASLLGEVPAGATMWALVPNRTGAELAGAAGVDHLTITISASAAYSEKNTRMTIGEAMAQVAEIREAAPGAVLDEVVSCCFGSPFEGEDVTPDDVAGFVEHAAAVGVDRVTLADTTGMATPAACGGRARPRRHRRRAAPPRHPRHRAPQRVDGPRARRRPLRHRPRRTRRLAVRARRRRQPRHRGPRPRPRRLGLDDGHRPRRPPRPRPRARRARRPRRPQPRRPPSARSALRIGRPGDTSVPTR